MDTPQPAAFSRRASRARQRILGSRPGRFRPLLESLESRLALSGFEVWAIDQSNTYDENANGSVLDGVDSGGTLYIYRGADLAGRDAARAAPEVIDLGGAARDLALAQTGTAPIRPHMFFFNSTHSHAIISFVASGHVLFMDTATRNPLAVIDVGVQAHAAIPAPDDNYVIVANQNGKLLHRIWTDYATGTFTLDPVPLNLAVGTTPSGAPRQDPVLRPDNAPICGVIDPTSSLTFVTLRGGGLFVIDSKADLPGEPLSIVNEYDKATIHRDGCGGVITGGKLYINSGGPGEADLYAFDLADFDGLPDPPNSPARKLVFSQDGNPSVTQVDSHGATLTRHGRYLWVADRWANKIVVVDTETDEIVNEIGLAGDVSGDPAPDLLATSPDGNRVFVALRGPQPLTANNPAFNNAVGSTPGVGVIQVTRNGQGGKLMAVAPVSHVVAGLERADIHGIGVRLIHGGGLGADAGPVLAAAWLADEASDGLVAAIPTAARPNLPAPDEPSRRDAFAAEAAPASAAPAFPTKSLFDLALTEGAEEGVDWLAQGLEDEQVSRSPVVT
jgi:hypothetical protein